MSTGVWGDAPGSSPPPLGAGLGYSPAQLKIPAPPPPPLGFRWNILLSWVAIAACLATIVILNQVSNNGPKTKSQQIEPNVVLELLSRYVVGAAHALPKRSEAADPTKGFLEQVEKTATTPVDRLRTAMVAGEIDNGLEALRRIDALAPSLASPEQKADVNTLRALYEHQAVSAARRKLLVDRYGWFGSLAAGFGQPDSDPNRQAAHRGAVRAIIIIISAGAALLIGLLAGLVLLIVFLVRFADGKITLAYVPPTIDTSPFLEAFAIYLSSMIGISLLVGRFSGHFSTNAIYLIASCVPVVLAVFWPLVRGVGVADWRLGLGWHAGKGVFKEFFLGLVGYLAGLPLLAVGVAVSSVLAQLSGTHPTHPIVNEAQGFSSALKLFLLAAVFAPIAEETLFRGALFHHLRRGHGWWISAAVVSLIFAALHPQGWAGIPPLFMIAMTLGAIRQWRGTFIASAAGHALNNGFLMLILVIGTS